MGVLGGTQGSGTYLTELARGILSVPRGCSFRYAGSPKRRQGMLDNLSRHQYSPEDEKDLVHFAFVIQEPSGQFH